MQIPGPLSSPIESHSLSVGSRCVLQAGWVILIHTHPENCCSNSASMLSPDCLEIPGLTKFLQLRTAQESPSPHRVSCKSLRLVFRAPHELAFAYSSPHHCFPWTLGFSLSTPSYNHDVLNTVFSPLLLLGLINLYWSFKDQSKGLFFFEAICDSFLCTLQAWNSNRLRFQSKLHHLLAVWPQERPWFLWDSVLSCREWG